MKKPHPKISCASHCTGGEAGYDPPSGGGAQDSQQTTQSGSKADPSRGPISYGCGGGKRAPTPPYCPPPPTRTDQSTRWAVRLLWLIMDRVNVPFAGWGHMLRSLVNRRGHLWMMNNRGRVRLKPLKSQGWLDDLLGARAFGSGVPWGGEGCIVFIFLASHIFERPFSSSPRTTAGQTLYFCPLCTTLIVNVIMPQEKGM